MTSEIWVLGATGRIGGGVTERLLHAGLNVVVAGRSREHLTRAFPTARTVTGSLKEICTQLSVASPDVVVNTVGPFAATAAQIARACPPGTHYVDVANDLRTFETLNDMDHEAVASDRALVYGAGFGVLGTESILLHLLSGEDEPSSIRVDAIASVATEPGKLGDALAATIVDSLRAGGHRVRQGRVEQVRVGGERERMTTPDGDLITTSLVGRGDLFAAWKASGAPSVVAASAIAPGNPMTRAGLITAGAVLGAPGMSTFAAQQLARLSVSTSKDRPRESSWARAHVEWSTGKQRTGWLRAGEGMAFTINVAAEVAQRLANGEGRSGASSPGRLFGPQVALAAGAQFVDAPR